jgi:hypothetical protein
MVNVLLMTSDFVRSVTWRRFPEEFLQRENSETVAIGEI